MKERNKWTKKKLKYLQRGSARTKSDQTQDKKIIWAKNDVGINNSSKKKKSQIIVKEQEDDKYKEASRVLMKITI